MAGFRKDRTTAAQTAANVAGEITVARIASGEFGSSEGIDAALVTTFQALFAELGPVVDADNALFEAVENAASANKSVAVTTAPASGEPGDTVFAGGKFKGLTIKDVYEMSEAVAKDTYKHPYGAGSTYVVNYVATDKNSNETTKVAAQAFLAALPKAA